MKQNCGRNSYRGGGDFSHAPDCIKLQPLTERLASLGIMGDKLRAPLIQWSAVMDRGALDCALMMPRDAVLSDSCTMDVGCDSNMHTEKSFRNLIKSTRN